MDEQGEVELLSQKEQMCGAGGERTSQSFTVLAEHEVKGWGRRTGLKAGG